MSDQTNLGGRPPFYSSVEDMQIAIDKYFATTQPGFMTVTGLALALGFTSRAALLNYEDKPAFVNAVKSAKLRIENDYELSLREKGRSGDIFGLKNFGWRDQQDVNLGGQNGENPIDVSLKLEFVKTPE